MNRNTFKVQEIWNALYLPETPKSRNRGQSDCLLMKKKYNKTKKKSKKGHMRTYSDISSKKSKKKSKKGHMRTCSVISSKKYKNSINKIKANTTRKSLQSDLYSEICQSLQFGSVNVQQMNKKKGSKSDKLSFWFSIAFNVNHREKKFLYFYYIRDEYLKQKKGSFMPIITKKSRITCDFECAQKNIMVNDEKCSLPKDILIEIFKYTKPRKMIELYSYNMAIDNNPFGGNHFIGSNLEWICNHFGVETIYVRKFLVKMLYFIYSPKIDEIIADIK
eukprot:479393_1